MIASDKTGTLTQNNMSVVEVLVGTRQVLSSDAAVVQAWKDYPEQIQGLIDIAVHCNAYVGMLEAPFYQIDFKNRLTLVVFGLQPALY